MQKGQVLFMIDISPQKNKFKGRHDRCVGNL
jgi:hypothetical protein